MTQTLNREGWLTLLAVNHLWPLIESHGGKVPSAWRVSVGFPKGSRGGKGGHAIGQCWPTAASADAHCEMFISPELEQDRAADVLLHELIHAATPGTGHKGAFKRIAVACGLTGKMTATVAGPELAAKIADMLKAMPPYPHGIMRVPAGAKAGPGSRLLKVSCPACDYTMRVTRTWLEVAVPCCPDPDCDRAGESMEVQS
jgi:hypothetical protein